MTIDQLDVVDGSALRRKGWGILAVLFLLTLVNYADKIVVGLVGVDMMKEVPLSPEQFGIIQSSFFWLFAIGSIVGGWLVGKLKVRWLLGGIAVLWAISLAPMIGQVSFTLIVACRVMLGFAEGPTTALAMYVTHSWFPANKRAVPTSLLFAAAGLGPVIAAPVLTWVIATHSWHAAFGVLVVVGVLVAALWLLIGREGPLTADAGGHGHGEAMPVAVLPDRVPMYRLLGTGTVIGLMLLVFSAYATTAVKATWLPLYLRQGLGYGAEATGKLVALVYLAAAIAIVAAGVVSRMMTKRGFSNRVTRGVLPGALVLTGGLTTIAFSMLEAGVLQMVLIVLTSCLTPAGYGIAFAGLADVAPARQRGAVFGIVTAFYSLGGIIAPVVIGKLVGASEKSADGYGQGFLILGVALLIGGLAALVLVNSDRDAAKLAARAERGY
ncbi:MFS transporter [Saccharopolyspora sp. NPDC002376]